MGSQAASRKIHKETKCGSEDRGVLGREKTSHWGRSWNVHPSTGWGKRPEASNSWYSGKAAPVMEMEMPVSLRFMPLNI